MSEKEKFLRKVAVLCLKNAEQYIEDASARANGDGVINLIDLMLTASKLGKAPPFGYPIPIPFRTDTNNDGKINVLDLIAVANSLHI